MRLLSQDKKTLVVGVCFHLRYLSELEKENAHFTNQNGACFDEVTETTYEKWLKKILKANKQKEGGKKYVFLSLGSLRSVFKNTS